MMKFIVATLLMILTATSSFANDSFYFNQSKNWTVRGVPQRDKLSPVCAANYTWNDGSEFNLIKDMVDGELYILFINNQWNIADDVNKFYNFRINVHTDGVIRGLNGEYELLNKSAIRVRQLRNDFVDMFAQADEFRFIMPGSITNARIPLNGTMAATQMLNECVRAFRK